MTYYVVTMLVREVEGEYCFLRIERGFLDVNKARTYAHSLPSKGRFNLPTGLSDCIAERGIHEIEFEENVDKMFLVGTLARQVEGEVCFVKLEKAFSKASLADEYCQPLPATYIETVVASSEVIACMCERGVFEVDIDNGGK